ncbi:MAG: NADPH-dependent 7-cyano-7-deazaguanine reductase QueF [Candidatus Omnitrophota bacterium]|nr:MAG: NADPH-dependent 7-cyano-7-deazaguanine reductase QueF [Candidatus Omnitrophota bacterium]
MEESKKQSSYENLQAQIRDYQFPEIEVWTNLYSDKDYWIELEVPEFTCICPKTGLPDFAKIKIKYQPDLVCIELKSFKYYINAYRNIGIFHENAANKMLSDFVKACRPRQVKLCAEFNLRGGIKTTVTAEYVKKCEK